MCECCRFLGRMMIVIYSNEWCGFEQVWAGKDGGVVGDRDEIFPPLVPCFALLISPGRLCSELS